MKYSILVIIFLSVLSGSSQEPDRTIELMEIQPFHKKYHHPILCGRNWMMPESRMDSLKQEIKSFEQQLSLMSEDSIVSDSLVFLLLYSTEYITRIEFDGEINEQFCATDSSSNKRLKFDSDKAKSPFSNETKSYENKYLVNSNTYYYLGNCQIFTTVSEYYIRKDLYVKRQRNN